jgi:hypothetical protein
MREKKRNSHLEQCCQSWLESNLLSRLLSRPLIERRIAHPSMAQEHWRHSQDSNRSMAEQQGYQWQRERMEHQCDGRLGCQSTEHSSSRESREIEEQRNTVLDPHRRN